MSRLLTAATLLLAAGLAGCGGTGTTAPATTAAHPRTLPATVPAPAPGSATRPAPTTAPTTPRPASRPAAPTCPAGAANCTAASGRVLALESVDPDGDGDLHLILVSTKSVTLPGITVLDINKDLRPAVDPKAGDWAAGAGPVYRGSHGQQQIQVERVVYDPTR